MEFWWIPVVIIVAIVVIIVIWYITAYNNFIKIIDIFFLELIYSHINKLPNKKSMII